jgi:hypothetical protein
MKPAIDIRNLGKQYELNESAPYVALRDILSQSGILICVLNPGKELESLAVMVPAKARF